MISGGWEGLFVELFRHVSLECSKVEGSSLEAILEEFRAWAVFEVEVAVS